MTPFNTCPACVRVNLPDARICSTCGATLHGPFAGDTEPHSEAFIDLGVMESDLDTTPSVHLDAPELQRWFHAHGGFDTPADHGHAHPLRAPEPPLPPLSLRDVHPVPDLPRQPPEPPGLPPGVVQSDAQAQPPYSPPHSPPQDPRASAPSGRSSRSAPPAAQHATAPTAPAAMPTATKAQRRAQVRRKLLATKEPAVTAAPADVLVLDGDDAAREQLCTLLTAFGFRTHPVQSTMQAVRMLVAKRYAAAFLNIIFDGSAAPAAHDLCSRVKAPPPHADDAPCALIIVTGAARPVERVRAELAGCDAFLLKPVSRGSVAQALEACGVPLPIDSRRN